MRINELDYTLPAERIATHPVEPRDHSRLMVVDRAGRTVEHRRFHQIAEYLCPGDLLVVNDTRVLAAKLVLRRATGAVIPGLFLREISAGRWEVLLRTRGKVKPGEALRVGGYRVLLERRMGEGLWQVAIEPADPAARILGAIGHTPLPPYIEKQRKRAGMSIESPDDPQHYQTVYARRAEEGRSVAAPTAGLHFTPELLRRLDDRGIRRTAIELEVGLGTFLPVESETLEEHPMHSERFHIPAAAILALRQTREAGGRIIPVGTTAVRALEAAAGEVLDLSIPPSDLHAQTTLKIAPGFAWRITESLVTNFHLPRSTLMALVAAFLGGTGSSGGVARLKALYAEAIEREYRFYSYGDAMLIV